MKQDQIQNKFRNQIFFSGKNLYFILILLFFILLPLFSMAASGVPPSIGRIRVEFILFALTLIGVAVFHHKTFYVAIIGLSVILLFKFIFDPAFNFREHFLGSTDLITQFLHKDMRQGEWSTLLNLLGLLLGFSILSKHFEESGVPDYLPKWLPDDWKGPFVLLVFIFILSSFLDNIAAALIGGTIALVVFNRKVHLGYIAAIVAASNAGGSGSVLGDTTTTMMWIDGVSPLNVLHAYIAAVPALFIFSWYASKQQDKYHRIQKDPEAGEKIQLGKLVIVVAILAGAILSNILYDLPALGVWVVIVIGAIFLKTPWKEVPASIKGTVFLLCLVTCASLMPVDELPPASWMTVFILGFVSAVFDNIPLTKLCLEQGCYDWGMLAYAVGFGGSMIWFGSSAGVAICNKFPEARNVGLWLRKGWHIMLAYIVGFFILYLVMGWDPADNKKVKIKDCPCIDCPDNSSIDKTSSVLPVRN
jgi:Na+/H+ antiporter NhaD/arsenite permease-like protein